MEPNYGLIFDYGVQMTLTFAIGLALYSIRVHLSTADTASWYKSQAHRIVIALVLFWLLSAGLVVVPNLAQILGAFGFNADQSAAGIAIVVVGFLIGGSSLPKINTEEQ